MSGADVLMEPTALVAINLGTPLFRQQRDALQEWAKATATNVSEYPDTFVTRQWLRGIANNAAGSSETKQHADGGMPVVAVIGYEPQELWSLIVLLSHLESGDAQGTEVVLIAEGPVWALPVLITDFPRLTVVPPGASGREPFVVALQQALSRVCC
ncbi:hypothetical protein [Arthrobacter sulfonylureivorans]|uniref:Uncharacterized protein n=1 Tax=Arthrobacter sulfonylureivorans TaxID=2486855 RepID=A0ABY3WE33_9MICC|nr:hypothetical protein [Arthrobacter sulfonylureivorans]UNK47741.1 hypothetical protein MNQ99_18635 [Arthrobacter sulfonylureivorans]